jgi:peptidoglycan hydrolase CwlO-like protein
MEWLVAGITLVGIIVSSVVTWLIAKRTTSGSISTSDAASLWEESNNLRQEYKDRAEKLEKQLEEVNRKLDLMTAELNKLRTNSNTQLEKIKELKTIITELRQENQKLLALKKEVTP